MAEYILQTTPNSAEGVIIQLRYDTYNAWMASDRILKRGEVAIAAFPNTINANLPPKIGLKIGDGTHYFDELLWTQGVAADVYDWAKKTEKPTYYADEIDGLTNFIQQIVGSSQGGVIANSYRIIYDSNNLKYILQLYDEEFQVWENTSSEISFTEIYDRINSIERWANGAKTNLGNIEFPLDEYIYETFINYLTSLNYEDQIEEHTFVKSVSQINGKINVQHGSISTNDISSGILSTSHGGTGLDYVENNEVLVGSGTGNITTRQFVTTIGNDNNVFATTGAIKNYVQQQTVGLTGAMHFVGESNVIITTDPISYVNPQIPNYDFSNAEPGDVILANRTQEFVWTGTYWRLLGDEGSYAIKGHIMDADINANADISQSKIHGLINDLTNLQSLAQPNIIEHIFVNNKERQPTEINSLPKSIAITEFDEVSKQKLNTIESGAQINTIESIILDGVAYYPNENKIITFNSNPAHENIIERISVNGVAQNIVDKEVDIILDQALNLHILEGATIPKSNRTGREEVSQNEKKLELERIAVTGDVQDLQQTGNAYIRLDCGTSISDIHPTVQS